MKLMKFTGIFIFYLIISSYTFEIHANIKSHKQSKTNKRLKHRRSNNTKSHVKIRLNNKGKFMAFFRGFIAVVIARLVAGAPSTSSDDKDKQEEIIRELVEAIIADCGVEAY